MNSIVKPYPFISHVAVEQKASFMMTAQDGDTYYSAGCYYEDGFYCDEEGAIEITILSKVTMPKPYMDRVICKMQKIAPDGKKQPARIETFTSAKYKRILNGYSPFPKDYEVL